MSERTEPSETGVPTADDGRTALACCRSLVETVDAGVFQLDVDDRFVAVDDSLLEATGHGREELLDEHVSVLLQADDGDFGREPDDVTTLETAVDTADGDAIPCRLRWKPIQVESRFEGTVGVVRPHEDGRDSEPTEPDRGPIDSSEPTSTVLDAADVGVFVLDEEFDVVWINEATERYFGIDREDVVGRDKRRLIAETIRDRLADPETFEETVVATYDDNSYVERFVCHVTPGENREERWLEHRSRPIETGRYAGGRVELYYDVTDQHERVAQLRRLNEAVREWLPENSRESVAESASRHVRDVFGLEINGIYLYDPDENALEPAGWTDTTERLFDELPTFPASEGIAWRVYESGEPAVLDDVTENGDVYNPETPIRSEIVLPIGDHGVVLVGSTDRTAFDDGDLSVAKILASTLEAVFDRIRQGRAIERERAQTAKLFETAPVAISVENADGETVRSNRRLRKLLGVTESVPIGKAGVIDGWTVYDTDGEPLAPSQAPVERVRATGEPVYDRELALEGPTEDREWFSVNAAPVFGSDGSLEQVVSVGENVTELKAQEQRLQRRKSELESELDEIFGRISDGFYALDDEWRFTHVNDRAEELLGYSREELVGEVVWDVFPGGARSDLIERYREAMATQEPVSWERYSETLEIWMEIQAYPSESGLSVYFRDVTERKERVRRLEASEQRYRTLVEHFPDGVVTLFDDDLRYTAAGGELVDDLGIGHGGTIGQTIYEQYPDEFVAEIEPHFRAALEGEERSFEIQYRDRALSAHTLPIEIDGSVDAGMFVVQDVTERKEYQRKLEASNERLEQFAYSASHDLQEPLRMVSSYLQLIDRRYGDALDEDGREFLEYAVDGADRMKAMIDGLLAYSRVETQGEPFEPVDLEVVLEDVRDDLALRIDEQDATVTIGSLPTVRGDADQLRQVFQNLLSNALEYSGDEPPTVEVSAERVPDGWTITVRDEGIGIDPADQERIFEVFNRLHSQDEHSGTGIGLALCNRIVERHNGEIRVDSELGKGAAFSVMLPSP